MNTFNQDVQRIGFACKINATHDKAAPNLNTGTTTITWLNSQTKDKAVDKLWLILEKNTKAVYEQVLWLSRLPPNRRMFRISSDLLPAYTHDDWMWFYFQQDVVDSLSKRFGDIGDLARKHDVRLSFHPGQFCVLASDRPDVVENSITEFEYHTDIARYMGYGKNFQDFKCNVHIGGKGGPDGIKAALRKLSREARNIITIENDEFKWGIESSLELVNDCALVLDIHHHLIRTGEYIQPTDPRVVRVIDSWRGVRPVIHYSLSREDCVVDHDPNALPNIAELVTQGFTKAKLRAHSDYYWNHSSNRWALGFNDNFDIMCESKQKNLAVDLLCEYQSKIYI
jgi:UV damage endonuclease UvdE